jgi:hypothetical protein
MKRLAIFVLALMLGVSVAKAQVFTTPDGAFTVTLLDGTIDTSLSTGNLHMWQTWNTNHTESVAALEEVNLPPTSDTQAELNGVRDGALSAGGTLLADQNGTFNGFAGKQFTIQTVTSQGVHITYTSRVWASRTGKTVYTVVVYELSNNLPEYQNRVDWFLNSAVLPN